MTLAHFLLLLAALACFVFAVYGSSRAGLQERASRVNYVALGLAFWVAVPLLQTLRALT